MKVGVFFFTTSGNTEEMAKGFAEGLEKAGAEVVLKNVSDVDASDFDGCDAFALGSPAQGSEEMDESTFLPFYEEHKERMNGSRVFLFGSFGWGGGQYMEDFAEVAKGDGLDVVEVYTHLEDPDDDTLDELRSKAQEFVG